MVSLDDMRCDARAAYDAAVAASQPQNLVPGRIQRMGSHVIVAGENLARAPGRHVVMSIGKAAPGMAAAWLDSVSGWTDELVVLAPHGVAVPVEVDTVATVLRGAHPYPDADGEASTRRLLDVARSLVTDDLLVVLLSGGGWAAASTTRLIGNNRTAVRVAVETLRTLKCQVDEISQPLVGEASMRGRELAVAARRMESTCPIAVVFGGETTVTVRGSGRGGRNQELALAAAIEMEDAENIVVLAAGTDGIDGTTENAGAIVDPSTAPRLRRLGLDPKAVLENNDSGATHETVGDAFRTGPTGTNVCGVTLVLTAPKNRE
jgi:glycerate-2-kinase